MATPRIHHILDRAPAAALLVALAACGPADAGPRQPTAEEWRRDLAYLAEKLPARHGNAFHQVSRSDFEAAVARLDERIPELARHEILAEMGRIVALVGDGHTELWLPQQAAGFGRYPIALVFFGDELRVFAATPESADLIGRRVVAFDEVPAREAYARVVPLIARDNDFEYLRSAPRYLVVPEILHATGIAPRLDEVVLTLAGPEGESRVTLRPLVDPSSARWTTAPEVAGSETPLYRSRPERWYWFVYLEGSRTLYLKYDRCRDQSGEPSIKRFARELFEFVDSHSVERFIFDLRHNTGGNFHRNEPLIDGLRQRPELRLFAITSRTTFSAATIAAIDLKRDAGAILVGEPSRGRPNGYSDEKHLRLPNSGIEVNYSPLYREAMPELGDAPFLPVDLPVAPTFEEYRAGRDPVLAAILAYDSGEAAGR